MDLRSLYLHFGLATLIASALVCAYTILLAPFQDYSVIVTTNDFGEGLLEAALVLASLPAWFLHARQLLHVLARKSPVSYASVNASAAKHVSRSRQRALQR
jgi:hypothetical protein